MNKYLIERDQSEELKNKIYKLKIYRNNNLVNKIDKYINKNKVHEYTKKRLDKLIYKKEFNLNSFKNIQNNIMLYFDSEIGMMSFSSNDIGGRAFVYRTKSKELSQKFIDHILVFRCYLTGYAITY